MPRPPGAGRKKGTPNRATRDVREATQKRGTAALRLLWKLCNSKDEKVADAALARWLAYAFGRPVDRQELTGADGAPLNPAVALSDMAVAQRIAFTLARAAKAKEPTPTPRSSATRGAEIEELQRQRADEIPIPEPEPEPAANVVSFPEARPQQVYTPSILENHK